MTLYLTREEQALFAKLPAAVREGWNVEEEKRSFKDSDMLKRIRIGMAKFDSPVLKKMQTEAVATKDIVDSLGNITLDSLSDNDRAELFFVIGPQGMGQLILSLLPHAQSAEDMPGIAAFSIARKELLTDFSSVPA